MAEFGLPQMQARALVVAYQRDMERPLVTATKTYRPGFLDWLMREAPHGLKPARPIRRHTWRTTS